MIIEFNGLHNIINMTYSSLIIRLPTAFVLLISLFLHTAVAANPSEQDFLGEWQTIDDKTNLPRSVVTMDIKDGKLVGKITRLFPQPGDVENPTCVACKGDLKDTKVVGMQILSDMVFKNGEWQDGQILDPNNGKYYDCKIWLEDGVLKVRGYIGFFFRTQQWLRAKND